MKSGAKLKVEKISKPVKHFGAQDLALKKKPVPREENKQ